MMRWSRLLRRGMPQFRVLFRRKLQPDASPFFPDSIFDLLAPGNVESEATPFHQLEQLALVGKYHRTRETCLPVFLHKLAKPTLSKAELQEYSFRAHTCAALAEPLASSMRKRKRGLALAANFSRISLPY